MSDKPDGDKVILLQFANTDLSLGEVGSIQTDQTQSNTRHDTRESPSLTASAYF